MRGEENQVTMGRDHVPMEPRNLPIASKPPLSSSLKVQYGGSHYKSMAIQPIEYAEKNNLTAAEFSVVKYISRHRGKGGAEDIKKAIHFAQMLLEMQYRVASRVEYSREGDKS